MKRLSILLLLIISIQGFGQIQNPILEHGKRQMNALNYLDNFDKANEGNYQKSQSLFTSPNTSFKASYDSNGNIIMMVVSHWNTGTSQWDLYSKEEYSYNSNSNFTTILVYHWNTNQWVYNSKEEYSYDSNGNLTIKQEYLWDSNSNQWDIYSKTEYTYDSNGLGINDYFNENVKIYPNPITENSFTIETTFNQSIQLHLMDIHGRTILTMDLLQNTNLIRLENISDGLYFIQLLDKDKVLHQQKIIKRN